VRRHPQGPKNRADAVPYTLRRTPEPRTPERFGLSGAAVGFLQRDGCMLQGRLEPPDDRAAAGRRCVE
jgi:hypothetical protein